MEYFIIYLVTVADQLSTLMFVLAIILTAVLSIGAVCHTIDADYHDKGQKWRQKVLWFSFPIVMGFISALLPSKEESAAIYLLPKLKDGTLSVVESKTGNRLGNKMIQIFEKKLDEVLLHEKISSSEVRNGDEN